MKGLGRLDAFSLYMLSFFLSFGPPFTAAETIVFKWSISYWAAKVTPSPSFVLPRLNIPVLVSNGRWWLFSSSSLQPHIDLMHFVAATIFTFTIHSQRVVRLGHLCEKSKRPRGRLDEC